LCHILHSRISCDGDDEVFILLAMLSCLSSTSRHNCCTPSTMDSTALDSLADSPAYVTSFFLDSSLVDPLLLRSQATCNSPQVHWTLVSDDEVHIPCLHVPPNMQPSDLASAALLADSNDEFPFCLSHHLGLVRVLLRFALHTLCFINSSSTSPLFVHPQPAPQAGSHC
jgi:hypothetical protein